MIIRQIKGEYQCSSNSLMKLNSSCVRLAKQFPRMIFEHIPREHNAECDSLCRKAAEELEPRAEMEFYAATLDEEISNMACQVCNKIDKEATMMLCDYCGFGFH